MELSKSLAGRTPMITNVTVFSATAIAHGALLVTGASTTAQGAIVPTVATTTVDYLSVIGVTQEGSTFVTQSKENKAPNSHAFNIPSSGFPVSGTASTAGLCYLPTSINTDAAYFIGYSTTTGAGTASDLVATWTASTITALVRGTTGLDVLGGWIFSLGSVNSAGNTPTFSGQLRYIANQAVTTSVTLLTATSMSTDSHCIWVDRTFKLTGTLTSTGDKFRSHAGGSAAAFQNNGARLIKIENWMVADHAPLHPLRSWVDDGLNGLTNARFFGESVFPSAWLSGQGSA